MVNFKSVVKNCKFILNNLDSMSRDEVYEFIAFINYFVDLVIVDKYESKFKS